MTQAVVVYPQSHSLFKNHIQNTEDNILQIIELSFQYSLNAIIKGSVKKKYTNVKYNKYFEGLQRSSMKENI